MQHIVIIGNGTAGIHALLSIKGYNSKARVSMVSDDEPFFYSRPEITQLLENPAGTRNLKLPISGQILKDINLIHQRIEGLSTKNRRLNLANDTTLPYDKLVFATGSSPKTVSIVGVPDERIFTLRTAADARKIAGFLPDVSAPVILGGGLIGLKIAHTLTQLGKPPVVIVSSGQILSRTLDSHTAGFIQNLFEEHGVVFHLSTSPKSADWNGKSGMGQLLTDTGRKIPFDTIFAGKGVTPRVSLAGENGLLIESGGIATSLSMETSLQDHYAAGDCASIFNEETGVYENRSIWPVAAESGRVAGEACIGKLTSTRRFSAPVGRNAIPFFSIPIVSIGEVRGDSLKEVIFEDLEQKIFRKIFIKNSKIAGAVLVGDICHAGILFEAVRKKTYVRQLPDWVVQAYSASSTTIPSMEVLFS
jgi:nitrite reductase (NADH) large subunit